MDGLGPSPFVPLSPHPRGPVRPAARPRCAVPHVFARRFGRVLLMVCWYGDAGRVQWHDAITGAKLGEGPIARA